MSYSLDPDQDRHFVGPDLGSNCLQRFSADDKSYCQERVSILIMHIKNQDLELIRFGVLEL